MREIFCYIDRSKELEKQFTVLNVNIFPYLIYIA